MKIPVRSSDFRGHPNVSLHLLEKLGTCGFRRSALIVPNSTYGVSGLYLWYSGSVFLERKVVSIRSVGVASSLMRQSQNNLETLRTSSIGSSTTHHTRNFYNSLME